MFNIVKNYFVSTYVELTKVTWLTRDMLIKHTIIVLVAILVTMVIIGAMDYGLSALIKWIILREY